MITTEKLNLGYKVQRKVPFLLLDNLLYKDG